MADNITILDSTGTSKAWATSEGSDSQHRQHVVPTDDDGTKVIGTTADAAVTTDTTGTVIGFLRGLVTWFTRLAKLDGATFTRGSSYVWPGLAGIYESTVSTLTAGKVALARLTSRGAVVTAGDRFNVTVYDAMPGDASAYHITLGAVGASGSKAARIFVTNTTDVAVAVTILLYSTWSASAVYSESIAAGAYRMIGPGAASATGGSASYKQCDALGYLSHGAGVIYQAATPPTTGTLKIVAMVEV